MLGAIFPRSLRNKLIFFSLILVAFVAWSLSTYIRTGQKKAIIERQEQNQEDIAKALRQVARESILMDDDTSLVNYVNLLKDSPTLTYAMVVSPEKKVRVHTDPLKIDALLDDQLTQKALDYRAREKALNQTITLDDGTSVLDLSLPIILGNNPGEFRGIARVGFNIAKIDEEISKSLQTVKTQIFHAFIFALFLGLIGSIILARIITKPIEILKHGAQQIGDGKLNHRIEIHSRDEIRDLADEFNLMAQKLSELDQMKQDFVSNVTHELRSPMTSIRGYIDLLLQDKENTLNETQRDYLSIIKNSAVRLGRFIDNLLDVAKIEAHKLKLTPEIQPLHELAHEMVVLFKPQADEKKISLINNVPKNMTAAFVDKDKVAEVLINLTSNAIKFTPESGSVTLTAKEGSNYCEMSVIDTGVGIPSDMIGKLFNKFEQVKNNKGLARAQKGTGLGLTIAKGIVEAHGGKIWIESPVVEGKGTAFKFTLPKLTPEIEAKINS